MRSFRTAPPELTVRIAAGDWEQSTSTSRPCKNFAGRLSAMPADCAVCAAARLAASCSSTSNGEGGAATFLSKAAALAEMPYFCSFASCPRRSLASAATSELLLLFKCSSKARAASHFLAEM